MFSEETCPSTQAALVLPLCRKCMSGVASPQPSYGEEMVYISTILPAAVNWAESAKAMVAAGIVSEQERTGAGEVLNAAFMTYVAAAVSALMTLLYYLLRSGLLGGRDD